MSNLPILDSGFRPSRVIIAAEGDAVPASEAYVHKVIPHIIFMRNDNWSLGAPVEFETVAYEMWKNEWTHFAYTSDGKWRPIETYEK